MNDFLTPNAPTPGAFYLILKLPRGTDFLWLAKGALARLTQAWRYEAYGDLTPDEASEMWSKILSGAKMIVPTDVGTIVTSLRDPAPQNWIPCMGQFLSMADWPELMEVYPSVLKNYPVPGQFVVPDARGRVIVGEGTDAQGFVWSRFATGGSRTHTLSVTEMPAHTHSEVIAVPSVVNGGLEAPAPSATVSSAITGSAGGGQSHNNMPPYGVLPIFIVGRLFE